MSLFDQVHTMPLTQTLLLSVLPHAPVQQQICNVFTALRKGVRRLQDIYRDIVTTAASRSDEALPRPAAFQMALPFVFRPDNPVDLPPSLAGCVLARVRALSLCGANALGNGSANEGLCSFSNQLFFSNSVFSEWRC